LIADRSDCFKGQIKLTWTSPGEDGSIGTITSGKFWIKYSEYAIDWDNAEYSFILPINNINPGSKQTTIITGLNAGSTYYFWIRTQDKIPDNWSSVSEKINTWAQIAITEATISIKPESIKPTIIPLLSGEIKIEIPVGTFLEIVNMTVSQLDYFPHTQQTDLKELYIGLEMTIDKLIQPQKNITITIEYDNTDVIGVNESNLILCRYDNSDNKWITLQSTRYPQENKIIATITHLSQFQLMEKISATNLHGVIAYPNPFKPTEGHTNIYLKYLTDESTINIYTLSGELITTIEETNGDGQIIWNAKNKDGYDVASGVYIYLIKNPQGEKKIGKLAIIR